jgi:hypothetical protein
MEEPLPVRNVTLPSLVSTRSSGFGPTLKLLVHWSASAAWDAAAYRIKMQKVDLNISVSPFHNTIGQRTQFPVFAIRSAILDVSSKMKKSVVSPTGRLLAGLAVTLAAVGVFSINALHQIRGLEDLQTRTVDRNRKDSLQLLRIQNDLNELGHAMRDMLDGDEPYPLAAWKPQFDRTRADLADALRL